MRGILAVVLLAAGVFGGVAEAQAPGAVYVPYGGTVIAVPLGGFVSGSPGAPPVAPPVTTLPGLPPEWGLVRVDGLPPGAMLSIDGRPVGGTLEISGGWLALPPGPHLLDVTLAGGSAIRFTVVTPVESSGYQVVPKP